MFPNYKTILPRTVAESITTIEIRLLKTIQLSELDGAAWAKEGKEMRSPNLVDFIIFSNKFTFWIISEVLRTTEVTERARLVSHFLNIGEEMLSLKNYNGASLVILAIRYPAIVRLKNTWSLVDPKAKATCQKLYEFFLLGLENPENDYELYRNDLKTIQPPFIPFMRLLLEDLADASTNPEDPTLSTRHYKCQVHNSRIYGLMGSTTQTMAQRVVEENKRTVENAQSGDYDLGYANTDWEEYIRNYQALTNEKTYALSLQLEPRAKQSNTLYWVAGGALVVAVGIGAWYYVNNKNK